MLLDMVSSRATTDYHLTLAIASAMPASNEIKYQGVICSLFDGLFFTSFLYFD